MITAGFAGFAGFAGAKSNDSNSRKEISLHKVAVTFTVKILHQESSSNSILCLHTYICTNIHYALMPQSPIRGRNTNPPAPSTLDSSLRPPIGYISVSKSSHGAHAYSLPLHFCVHSCNTSTCINHYSTRLTAIFSPPGKHDLNLLNTHLI